MNPGDIYRPPGGPRPPTSPPGAYASPRANFPTSQTYPSANPGIPYPETEYRPQFHPDDAYRPFPAYRESGPGGPAAGFEHLSSSQTQPLPPGAHPSAHPGYPSGQAHRQSFGADQPPRLPSFLSAGQSQPFPASQSFSGSGQAPNPYPTRPSYDDPFANPPTALPDNHHFPSQPNLSFGSQPFDPPSRNRFSSDAGGSLVPPSQSFTQPHSYTYGLSDSGLISPPPLIHQSSSSTSFDRPYPAHPLAQTGSNPYDDQHQAEDPDEQPLLYHATPDPRLRFAPSPSHSPRPARYQLQDNGGGEYGGGAEESDIGMPGGMPGGMPANGYANGGLGMYGVDGMNGMNGMHGMNGTAVVDEDNNVHYGPLPTRMVRRNKTQKRVA